MNGFLKEKCDDVFVDLLSFKCPFSEESYWTFDLDNDEVMINATCSKDPYGYQVLVLYH